VTPDQEKIAHLERVSAALRAVIDSPSVALFGDGRCPTENERHLLSLLSWRMKEAREAKEEAERARQALRDYADFAYDHGYTLLAAEVKARAT